MLKKLLLAFLLFAAPALAQDPLTTVAFDTNGACGVMATIENISVSGCYTGDGNENATALVQFRESGSGTWLNAYTPMIDRRYVINSVTNSRSREARVSIVGSTNTSQSPISPNTLYEVQITWTDPDGVVGTNPQLTTVTTYPSTPSIGTGTCAATDDASLATCLGAIDATHATVTLAAGTYAPFTVSRGGGASSTYAVLDFAAGAVCAYTSSASNQCINVTANYVWLKTPQFGATYRSGIRVAATGFYATDINMPQVESGCGDSGESTLTTGPAQSAAGILDVSGTEHFGIGGSIGSLTLATVPACTPSSIPNANPTDGIHITTGGRQTIVYKNIVFSGGFRDCVGGDGTISQPENVDLIGLTLQECKDDGIDIKGSDINFRVAETKCLQGVQATTAAGVLTKFGITCLAPLLNNGTTLPLGPLYIHHNHGHPNVNASAAGYYMKLGGAQVFAFNNTFDGTLLGTSSGTRWATSNCIGAYPNANICHQFKSLNNIFFSGGEVLSGMGSNILTSNGAITHLGEWDYDIIQTTGPGSYIKDWDSAAGDYLTITSYTSATGQEVHGYKFGTTTASMGLTWLNGVGTTTTGSYPLDKGTTIANFNDSTSAWPCMGLCDIGAYEFNSGAPAAPVPGGGLGVAAGSVTQTTLTLTWAKATDADTAQASLQYEVCQSSVTITSVATCEAATVIRSFTADIATFDVTGLSANTTYHFGVVVYDATTKVFYSDVSATTQANVAAPVTTSSTPGSPSRLLYRKCRGAKIADKGCRV